MQDIKPYLKNLEINFKTFYHPQVFTCEQADRYNKEIRGIHSKNLFLKDKKGKRFFLIIIPADKKLEIKEFEKRLNNKLKFANENDLIEILNLETGSVSPFGLINDKNSSVEIMIDKDVWNSDFVSFHPNINTETIELNIDGFHKFINSLKNKLTII